MKCPNCGLGEAIKDHQLGYLPCISCRGRHKTFKGPDRQIEFTSDSIKEGRKEYFKSTIQRYRDGRLSREFIEAYPERAKAMVEQGIHTQKEIDNAKNVWGDISPAGGIDRTK